MRNEQSYLLLIEIKISKVLLEDTLAKCITLFDRSILLLGIYFTVILSLVSKHMCKDIHFTIIVHQQNCLNKL